MTDPGSTGTLVLGKLGPLGKSPGGQKNNQHFPKVLFLTSQILNTTSLVCPSIMVSVGGGEDFLTLTFLPPSTSSKEMMGLVATRILRKILFVQSDVVLKLLVQITLVSLSYNLSFTSTQLRRLEKSSWRRPYEK